MRNRVFCKLVDNEINYHLSVYILQNTTSDVLLKNTTGMTISGDLITMSVTPYLKTGRNM